MVKVITIFGSLNIDLVTVTDKIPGPGETYAAKSFTTFPGGKGANQALAVARSAHQAHFGSTHAVIARMVGRVGRDVFGVQLTDYLLDSDVDTTNVLNTGSCAQSGTATIIVEEATKENRILVTAGANGEWKPEQISKTLIDHRSKLLIVQNELPVDVVFEAINIANEMGIPVLYNPSPVYPVPDYTYSLLSYLVLNANEASTLSGITVRGKDTAEKAVEFFLQKGVQRVVFITLGADGIVFSTPSGTSAHIPAVNPPYGIVDTTGAGDTFLGSLATKLIETNEIESSVKFAATAAALAIGKAGAGASIPKRHEIEQYYSEY